jgi:nucleotide-binding universal stress UspA family protein
LSGPKWLSKILVPIDGSAPCVVAQELAAFLAKKFGSQVTVIHAISQESTGLPPRTPLPDNPEYAPVGFEGGEPPFYVERPGPSVDLASDEIAEEITESLHEMGTAIVAEAVALFREQGIEADQKIENSDPTEAILKEAESGKYDLIIMGSSGEEEQESHLGSVAKKVSLHAKTSVLATRGRNSISKILVPVDGSQNAQKALQYAVVLAEKTDAKMTLMNVLEPRLFNIRPKLSKDIGDQILSHAASYLKGTKIDQKLESGDPAKTIIKIAKDGDYDLIAMGSKGHGTIRRLVLGSVTDHVIHYTDRSVLLVK